MENASKALLIAGSILVVILLIAMGVRVFNSTSGTTDSVEGTMQTTEATMFNNKFTQYVGTKSATQARSLINMVISNNATNTNHTVTINSSSPNINMELNAKVTIQVFDNNNDGFIDNININ